MAYSSWSVVFSEQPSAAKWNILGTNDASFNDGTGIFGLYKNLLAVDSNPYKFSAYRSSAQNSGNNAFAITNFNAELYDTNSNFDIATNVGRYTAPVSGFYHFSWLVSGSGSTGAGGDNVLVASLYKNGSVISGGTANTTRAATATSNTGTGGSDTIQLTAGNYVEVYTYGNTTIALATGQQYTRFSGFLVSRT